MRATDIFDTNILSHVESGQISESDWRFLLRYVPRYRWRLSMITALELLHSIHGIPPEKFSYLRRRVELAFAVSKGRILKDPLSLLCAEVFHIPFRLAAPAGEVVSLHLDIVRHATTLQQILEGCVPFKGKQAGFKTTSAIDEVVNGPKREWVKVLEQIATTMYPGWREHLQREGTRLPSEMCKEIESPATLVTQKRALATYLLNWLEASIEPASVTLAIEKLDASLDFANFVLCKFLTGNYSVEKHSSDIYDQFQLRYLAMNRFVIVTNDRDLSVRTAQSFQADRILTFEQFLRTL
jgi:hypothetical protein